MLSNRRTNGHQSTVRSQCIWAKHRVWESVHRLKRIRWRRIWSWRMRRFRRPIKLIWEFQNPLQLESTIFLHSLWLWQWFLNKTLENNHSNLISFSLSLEVAELTLCFFERIFLSAAIWVQKQLGSKNSGISPAGAHAQRKRELQLRSALTILVQENSCFLMKN